MLPIVNYDTFIFDCDGVILDSNQLKIDAMYNALSAFVADTATVRECIDYFRVNFGRSRFHHIDVFIERFLLLEKDKAVQIKQSILHYYSEECKALYLKAELTPEVIDFISQLEGNKFIASGSEQQELRDVFLTRGLDIYFDGIYGSPTKKSDLVTNILERTSSKKAIMFGDAVSDLNAANVNAIDFIAFLPFSNVKEKLITLANKHNYKVINKWSELL
jgi:phosphoglycolate phosphatase-like HAD superfamily hydrolase